MLSRSAAVAWSLLLCLLWSDFTFAISTFSVMCSAESFGSPNRNDCFALYARITDWGDTRARLFNEEDRRARKDYSWPGVDNPFQTEMVQIPKYWSYSETLSVLKWFEIADGSRIL